MKVRDLIDRLNYLANNGFGNVDVGLIFHNTVHNIDQILVGTNDDSVEDVVGLNPQQAKVIYMTRDMKPTYFMYQTNKWKRIDE